MARDLGAGSSGPRIAYDELVEQARCFGWIVQARRPATRAARVAEAAGRAAAGEQANSGSGPP